eukprot:360592-Chlamydomonas_euryale.AAC.4
MPPVSHVCAAARRAGPQARGGSRGGRLAAGGETWGLLEAQDIAGCCKEGEAEVLCNSRTSVTSVTSVEGQRRDAITGSDERAGDRFAPMEREARIQ